MCFRNNHIREEKQSCHMSPILPWCIFLGCDNLRNTKQEGKSTWASLMPPSWLCQSTLTPSNLLPFTVPCTSHLFLLEGKPVVSSMVGALVRCSEYSFCFTLKLSMKSWNSKIYKVIIRDLTDCKGIPIAEEQLT